MDDLIRCRLLLAGENLTSAKLLLDAGLYKESVEKSYNAICSAIEELLTIRQVAFSKHLSVIPYFEKEFIKTEIFDKKYKKYLQQILQIRNVCCFDDSFIVSKQDAEEQYERAVEILEVISEYIRESGNGIIIDVDV